MKGQPVNLSEDNRVRWAKMFACRTPDKIKLEKPWPDSSLVQCRGCSGSCGTNYYAIEQKAVLKQTELAL